MTKNGDPEWFDAQYKWLPFLFFSCEILGHGGMGCDKPAVRNDQGRLPYEHDPPLRAPDDRSKKVQSFVDAAAESFGSAHSSSARPTRLMSGKSRDGKEERSDGDRQHATVLGD